jgi:hypothetical protein
VEESWVSQLMAEEEFREEVERMRGEAAAGRLENDKRIDSIEDRAWQKVEQLLPIQTDIMKVLKVAQAANTARRTAAGAIGVSQPSTVVQLTLPTAIHVEFKMSSDRQVVEVDNRPLQTMASSTVHALLNQQRAHKLLTDATPQVDDKTQRLLNEF